MTADTPRPPHDAADSPLWGERTRRAIETFAMSRERFAPELIQGLAWVELACARANVEMGLLCPVRGQAIEAAARELIHGAHAEQFPLTVWQSASGRQTHANVDEVLAQRAATLLDESAGIVVDISAADDVGLGHDADEAFAAATHVASALLVHQRLLPALARLRGTLAAKSHFYRDLGRADGASTRAAAPTLGEALGAFETQLSQAQRAIDAARGPVLELAIGANADDATRTEFAGRACAFLAEATGHAFRPAGDRFAALASADAMVQLHAALKGLAMALAQLSDLGAWAGSQLDLDLEAADAHDAEAPACEVQPAMCQAMTMICAQVIGNDAALSAGAACGALRGHAARPLIAHALVQSLLLLSDGIGSFEAHLMRGLAARPRRERRRVDEGVLLRAARPDGVRGAARADAAFRPQA